MLLTKIHKISTLIGTIAIIISCTLLFLSLFDQILRLNIFPQEWEALIALGAWAFGSVALGSCVISVVLSFYRMANK